MHTDEKFSLKTDETTDAAGKPQLIPAWDPDLSATIDNNNNNNR
jgi:hypothetical protein